jgi:hypothetical protein
VIKVTWCHQLDINFDAFGEECRVGKKVPKPLLVVFYVYPEGKPGQFTERVAAQRRTKPLLAGLLERIP